MTLRIRKAGIDDAAAIARLGTELNEHEGDPVENFTEGAVRRDGFGETPQYEVYLAEVDGAPVAYALFYDTYETGYAARGLYLCDLHVTASARRQGVARTLVAAVARTAQLRGKSFLWWTSRARNRDAQAFYRSLGAVEEPVVAHALTEDAFAALAREGAVPDGA